MTLHGKYMTIKTIIQETRPETLSAIHLNEAQRQDLAFSQNLIEQIAQSTESEELKIAWITSFLSARWELIKGTELDYTENPQNPINQWCVAIANRLSHANEEISACKLLMPSVERLVGEVSSIYTLKEATEDEDTNFEPSEYLFVNNGFNRLLQISEFLNYTNADTNIGFKHFQLSEDTTCQYNELLDEHYEKLSALTPSMAEVYGAMFERHKQQHAHESLGSALREFCKAVRKSSTDGVGGEYQADTAALANRLLKMWGVYRNLPETVKEKMTDYSTGTKNLKNVLLTLFYGNPYCSKDMSKAEVALVQHHSFLTCTAILSDNVDAMLNVSENQWLFQLGLDGKPLTGKAKVEVQKVNQKDIEKAVASLIERKPGKPQYIIDTQLLADLHGLLSQPHNRSKILNRFIEQLNQKITQAKQSVKLSDFDYDPESDGYQHRCAEVAEKAFVNVFTPLLILADIDKSIDDKALSNTLASLIINSETGELNQRQLMRLLSLTKGRVHAKVLELAEDAVSKALVSSSNIDNMFDVLRNYEKHEEQELLFRIFAPYVKPHLTREHIQVLLERVKDLSPSILQGLLQMLAPTTDPVEVVDLPMPDEFKKAIAVTPENLNQQLMYAQNIERKLELIREYKNDSTHQPLKTEHLQMLMLLMFDETGDADMAVVYGELLEILESEFAAKLMDISSYLELMSQNKDNEAFTAAANNLLKKNAGNQPLIQLSELLEEHLTFFESAGSDEQAKYIRKHFAICFEANRDLMISQISSQSQKELLGLFIDTSSIPDYVAAHEEEVIVDQTNPLHNSNPEEVSPKIQPVSPEIIISPEKEAKPSLGTLLNLSSRYEKFIHHEKSNLRNARSLLTNYIRPGHEIGFFGFMPDVCMRITSGHINRTSIHLSTVYDVLNDLEIESPTELVEQIVQRVIETKGSAETLVETSSLYRRLDYIMRLYGDENNTLEQIIEDNRYHTSPRSDVSL